MTNCLTYEQLESYALCKSGKAERTHLYVHISSCEMCACAVNGFSAVLFTSDDLVAIHREIDVRANITSGKPLTLAQVFIVLLSVASVFGVYSFSDRVSTFHLNKTVKPVVKEITFITQHNDETKSEFHKEVPAAAKASEKAVNIAGQVKAERKPGIPERLDHISPIEVLLSEPGHIPVEPEEILIPVFNSEVIYIYDLKITDYNKFYFGAGKSANNFFKTHTPVFKENKTAAGDDFGVERQIIPADRVLKEGLAAFSRQKYSKALEHFRLLLENNPDDLNASFYAGICCFYGHKYKRAIVHLNHSLSAANNTFSPEAQWYIALANLRSGNRSLAKDQLEAIAGARGFYSRKAAEKLRSF